MLGRRRAGAAETISKGRTGFKTQLVERDVSVGTTITDILPNNPNRIFYEVVNRSVNKVYVSSRRDMTTTNARPLGPDGGFVTSHAVDDGQATAYPMFGLADVAASSVHVTEIIARPE